MADDSLIEFATYTDPDGVEYALVVERQHVMAGEQIIVPPTVRVTHPEPEKAKLGKTTHG